MTFLGIIKGEREVVGIVLFRLLKRILHGMTDKSNFENKVCLGYRRNKKVRWNVAGGKKAKIYDLSSKPELKDSNLFSSLHPIY